MTDVRYACVDGATYDAEVRARLRADGFIVRAAPTGAPLNALVVDLVIATEQAAFRAVTNDDWRALLDHQLYRFVAAVQAAVPHMAPGGAVVAIVPNAWLGAWGGVHVAASAAACVAMARSMALELTPRGIRVNSIATADPAGAWNSPAARADVAATVAWLIGPDSRQITGEAILADRGASLRMNQASRR